MKILIITYGSRGDVQPFVALGKGLKDAGHQVTLATSERFRDFITANSLEYGYMSDDLLAVIDTKQGKKVLENARNIFTIFTQNLKLSKTIKPLLKKHFRETWQVADAIQPDIIVYHPGCPAAQYVAEKLKVGSVVTTLLPMIVPTSERPFPIL